MTGTGNKDLIHRLVREQYEKYPYPAAQPDLQEFIQKNSFQGGCPSRFFHLYWPYRSKTLELDILVAGCGTMQAPKFAVNLPEARITAIDISDTSLENTNRLLKLHNINNVTTHKLPLEDVGSLSQSYDLVVATGVLHHLPDPRQGLTALHSVLKTDGSMYLMLYGKYGRDGIYYTQELLKRVGLTASTVTPEELSAVRQLVDLLPGHHPLAAKKHFFGNFQVGDEELVDLLLHPQDRGYSIPDIAQLLECSGMKLQSLLFRAHYVPRCCGLAASGFMDRIHRLPEVEQFAIGELYRAAVNMHFFVACKQARDEASYRINLDGPDWKLLVPDKSPAVMQDTVSPPAGHTAVIYSRIHQFRDIRCPIRAEEMTLLGMSQGYYSIGEIQAGLKNNPVADNDESLRCFYKKMHDYDFMSFRGST